MTDVFWEYVGKANARGIATAVSLLLVGVCVWSVLSDRTQRRRWPGPGDPSLEPSAGMVEKLVINGQAGDPFGSEYLDRLVKAREQHDSKDVQPAPGTGPAPEVPPPDAALEKPTWELLYRGMVQRLDGKLLALIDDLDAETSNYIAEGDSIGPFTVVSVGRHEVRLEHNGRAFRLELGTRERVQP